MECGTKYIRLPRGKGKHGLKIGLNLKLEATQNMEIDNVLFPDAML